MTSAPDYSHDGIDSERALKYTVQHIRGDRVQVIAGFIEPVSPTWDHERAARVVRRSWGTASTNSAASKGPGTSTSPDRPTGTYPASPSSPKNSRAQEGKMLRPVALLEPFELAAMLPPPEQAGGLTSVRTTSRSRLERGMSGRRQGVPPVTTMRLLPWPQRGSGRGRPVARSSGPRASSSRGRPLHPVPAVPRRRGPFRPERLRKPSISSFPRVVRLVVLLTARAAPRRGSHFPGPLARPVRARRRVLTRPQHRCRWTRRGTMAD